MHILSILVPYSYLAESPYFPIVANMLIRMCIRHGFVHGCATTFGWIRCSVSAKEGYRFGKLVLAAIDKMKAREVIPRVYPFFYGAFVHHWTRPLSQSLEPLQYSGRVALDVANAMISSYFQCNLSCFSGMALSQLEDIVIEATREMLLYQQEYKCHLTVPIAGVLPQYDRQSPRIQGFVPVRY